MPTPMYVYAEIAARFGINPDNEDAVGDFYEDQLQHYPIEVKQEILDELLARDGEQKDVSTTHPDWKGGKIKHNKA